MSLYFLALDFDCAEWNQICVDPENNLIHTIFFVCLYMYSTYLYILYLFDKYIIVIVMPFLKMFTFNIAYMRTLTRKILQV